MYRVAICEDEAAVRADTRKKCDDILARLGVPHELIEFSCAEKLETALAENAEPFDLLLLDIQLPGKTGIELGTALRRLNDGVGIIFITGNAAYAIEGYKAQPCNYLLKPVSEDDLFDALLLVLKRQNKHQIVTVREKGRTVCLTASEIIYIESFDHDIKVHTVHDILAFHIPLSQVTELVPPGMFARCHNSFFINLTYVVAASSTKVALRGGEQLPIGRAYRDQFHKVFVGHFL